MQIFRKIIFLLILLSFYSCQETVQNITEPQSDTSSSVTSYIMTGVFWQNSASPSDISDFCTYGYRPIILNAEWFKPDPEGQQCTDNWEAAVNAGYSPIIAQIWRAYAAENYDIDKIKEIIDTAKAKGADWIYIDDFLTYSVTGQGDAITEATIQQIHSYADSKGMLVAVSEDCESVYIWGQLQNEWNSLYRDYIDVVMPYGYAETAKHTNGSTDLMYNHLYNFYNYLQGKGKKIVPFLGYNTARGPSQLGALSGDTGFIELARSYAYNNMVLYYYEPRGNLSVLTSLTEYLQTYNYIVGVPAPSLPD